MRKQAAVKKAAMKKNKKAPKKALAASKAKKPAPAKKPAKPAAKPVKAKAPEKKPLKAVAPAKKAAAPAPAPKKDDKKAPLAVAGKSAGKKDIQEKVVMGKKGEQARPGAVAKTAPVTTPAPIKVEPKIIEAPQPEFKVRAPDQELFSNEELETFRDMLNTERNKILAKARKAMEEGNIQIDKNEMMDEVDQASAMVDQNLTFRLLDRDRKLLSEIEHAIAKIDTGDYGYCEGTGEPIPKRRLELRPWCRHSVKYKEKLERMKKSGRGVVDEDEA
jgi:DnaK suppressor protein